MVYLILLIMLFFVFYIIFSRRTPQKNTAFKNNADPRLQFHAKNTSIQLFRHTIKNSLFYTCTAYSELPFAVNTGITPVFDALPSDSLGYYPNYSILNKVQQGFYIKWLADGKPFIADLGYAYLYYYGLEYRALIEKQDLKDVLFEVIDLVNKFKQLKYAYSLIPYLILSIKNFSAEEKSILVKFLLANKQRYAHNSACHAIMKNLSPAEQSHIKFSLPQVLDTVLYSKLNERKKELLAYYLDCLQEQLNDTELYAAKKRTCRYDIAMKLHNSRYAANYIIEYDGAAPGIKLRNMLKQAVKTLSETKQSIKKFDNSDGALSEIEKLVCLPAPLRKKINPKTANIHFEDKTISSIETIAEKLGFKPEDKITLQQSCFIADACEALGYDIEPSASLTKKSYKKDTEVIVYKSPYTGQELSQNYPAAALFTDLGLKIALEDNEVLPSELSALDTYIQKEFNLSPAEHCRLQQREALSIHTGQTGSADAIKKLIKTLTESGRKTIAKFIISIAKADGIIKHDELKSLQKCFKQLGLSEEDLNSSLSELADNTAENIIIEKVSHQKEKGTRAPARPDYTVPIELKIDPKRLEAIKINTSEIHTVLEEIFTEEQKEQKDQSEPLAEAEENMTESMAQEENNGAETENLLPDIITRILEKESWSREELLNIIQNTGKMLASTIDEINAWSEEKYGDFLIEEEDSLYLVNEDVAELIKNGE